MRLAWMFGLFLALFVTAPAFAKAKVEVTSVELAETKAVPKTRQRQIERAVRRLAENATKHLNFGKDGKRQVSITIESLEIEESEGLVRISCTLLGKLEGGKSARSKISFGGRPAQKKKLERQVLASVTDGVMIRLAEMSQAKDRRASK